MEVLQANNALLETYKYPLGNEYINFVVDIQEITVCSQSYKIPLHLATFAAFALLESRRESTCR